MKNRFNFSFCLSQLLCILNISNNKLAKSINVDPSLVSKWKTGKREIALTSGYLDLISNYLSKNVNNKCEIEIILTLADKHNLSINIDIYNNTKAYIHRLLVVSLKKPFIEQNLNTKASFSQQSSTIAYGNINNYQIITGHKNVIAAGIELLKSLPQKPNNVADSILITFFIESDSFSNFEETNLEWNNTLKEVQEKGWSINKLISMNENKNRNKTIIDELLLNLETKKYNAFHLNNYDYLFHFKELIFIPTIGALLCYCGDDFDKIHSAFLFTDKQALKVFQTISKECLINSAPLITNNYSITNKDLLEEIIAYEELNCNRFTYNCFINYLTTPLEFYEKCLLLTTPNIYNNDINQILFYSEKVKSAFSSQVKNYNFNNIYSKKSIESIIKNHKFYSNILTSSDVIELLKSFVYLLETCENFNIAFLNDSNANISNNFSWIIKESNTIIIHNLSKEKNDINKVYISINEPTIVNAFTEYFHQLWRNIAPINKDKNSVISWFKTKIKSLNNL